MRRKHAELLLWASLITLLLFLNLQRGGGMSNSSLSTGWSSHKDLRGGDKGTPAGPKQQATLDKPLVDSSSSPVKGVKQVAAPKTRAPIVAEDSEEVPTPQPTEAPRELAPDHEEGNRPIPPNVPVIDADEPTPVPPPTPAPVIRRRPAVSALPRTQANVDSVDIPRSTRSSLARRTRPPSSKTGKRHEYAPAPQVTPQFKFVCPQIRGYFEGLMAVAGRYRLFMSVVWAYASNAGGSAVESHFSTAHITVALLAAKIDNLASISPNLDDVRYRFADESAQQKVKLYQSTKEDMNYFQDEAKLKSSAIGEAFSTQSVCPSAVVVDEKEAYKRSSDSLIYGKKWTTLVLGTVEQAIRLMTEIVAGKIEVEAYVIVIDEHEKRGWYDLVTRFSAWIMELRAEQIGLIVFRNPNYQLRPVELIDEMAALRKKGSTLKRKPNANQPPVADVEVPDAQAGAIPASPTRRALPTAPATRAQLRWQINQQQEMRQANHLPVGDPADRGGEDPLEQEQRSSKRRATPPPAEGDDQEPDEPSIRRRTRQNGPQYAGDGGRTLQSLGDNGMSFKEAFRQDGEAVCRGAFPPRKQNAMAARFCVRKEELFNPAVISESMFILASEWSIPWGPLLPLVAAFLKSTPSGTVAVGGCYTSLAIAATAAFPGSNSRYFMEDPASCRVQYDMSQIVELGMDRHLAPSLQLTDDPFQEALRMYGGSVTTSEFLNIESATNDDLKLNPGHLLIVVGERFETWAAGRAQLARDIGFVLLASFDLGSGLSVYTMSNEGSVR